MRPASHRFWFNGLAVGFALLALFIYGGALHGQWLWDDNSEFTLNPALRNPDGWWQVWRHPSGPDYFPLKTDLQWLEWRAFGADNTLGYHLVSLGLHVTSALIFIYILTALGMARVWAAVAGLLWMIHPLNVESVAWLAELKNTWSLPYLLLSFLAFITWDRSGSPRAYGISVACFLAAMLSKSTVVMLPPVLLLYAWSRRGKVTRSDLLDTLPFWIVALGLGAVTIHFQNAGAHGASASAQLSLVGRIAQAGWAFIYYVYSAVVPRPAAIQPAWESAQLLTWVGVAAWLGLFVATTALWRRGSKWGPGLLATGIFLLFLVPILGIIPMSFARQSWVADHFMYISLLGFAALVALGLQRLAGLGRAGRAAGSTAVAVISVIYIYSARAYAATFVNPQAFWMHALERNPTAAAAHYNLGLAELQHGNRAEARRQFESALAQRADDARTYLELAELTGGDGDIAGGLQLFARAQQIDPDLADVYYNRGNLLARSGRVREAVDDYTKAVQLAPAMADAHYNLATALAQLSEMSAAIGEYNVALRLAPAMGAAHLNLGNIYAGRSNLVEAVPHFLAAAAQMPDSVEAQFSTADALAAVGRGAEAIPFFQRALALDPHNSDIRQNYIAVLRTLGRSREALQEIDLLGK